MKRDKLFRLSLAILFLWTSLALAAPAAMAAMARGSTIQAMPAAWEGSTMMGRWLIFFTAGMAERSRVLRV